jgi:hypothetical protein
MALSRRLVIALVVLAASWGGAFAYAAFTAQTSTGGNSFSSGTWARIAYGGTGPRPHAPAAASLAVAYPSGTSPDDLLLLVEINAANRAITTPSGWTLLADQATSSPAQMRFTIWWKPAGSETSQNLSVNTNSSGAAAWVVR